MNLKDEALKMAIEALDTLMMEKGSVYQQAINACEEALASHSEALEQPAQEPVAWIYQSNSGHPALRWENTISFDFDSIAKKQPDIPLYTRPAQPLSDDEINKLLSKFVECLGTSHGIQENGIPEDNAVKFIRAIEQAHGIGESNETL